jgi:HSP20 family protein
VQIHGNEVEIRAAASVERGGADTAAALRSERYVGEQRRSLTLWHDIDEARAIARYEHGVLTLTLPKRAPRGSVVPVR